MMPPVARLLDEIKSIEELFRYKILAEEERVFPDMCYGSKTNQGCLWIFMECFGKYRNNFVAMVTEPVLKEIRSVEKFIEVLTSKNIDFSQKAESIERYRMASKPTAPVESIAEDIHHKRQQTAFRLGPSHQSRQDPAERHDIRRNFHREHDREDRQRFLRQVEEADTSSFLRHALNADEDRQEFDESARVFAAAYNGRASDRSHKFPSGPPPRLPMNGESPEKLKEYQANLVCFDFFNKRDCRKQNCPYSHEESFVRKYAIDRLEKLLHSSPFYTSDLVGGVLRDFRPSTIPSAAGASRSQMPSQHSNRPSMPYRPGFGAKAGANPSHMEIYDDGNGCDWEQTSKPAPQNSGTDRPRLDIVAETISQEVASGDY